MDKIPFLDYLAKKQLGDEKIIVHTRKGKCSKCGNCCSNMLPLSNSEITRIKNFIAEHEIKAEIHTTSENTFDMMCPFLNHENQCTIYEARPLICRKYKCNMKIPSWKNLQILMKEKRQTVDVRYTFFGDKQILPINLMLNILHS